MLHDITRSTIPAPEHYAVLAAAALRLHGHEIPVLAHHNGALVGLVYHADEAGRWYAMSLDACKALVAGSPDAYQGDRMGEPYSASGFYTAWCEAFGPVGEGPTADGALKVAGWRRYTSRRDLELPPQSADWLLSRAPVAVANAALASVEHADANR